MKSLVTGGAGFIGSHIVDKLIEIGHQVIVLDNESAECNEKFYYNSNAEYHKVDICDYEKTKLFYHGIDYVFHLAAESRLQPAIRNPIEAIFKNCVGTTTVLQCSREANVKKVIYSSTSSGYGLNPWPNHEEQLDDCLNPYSVSKVAAEKICKMYTDLYGLKTITFRYFNVYGERSPTIGQYAPVIGIFLKQKRNNEPLTIVGDGMQRRDFIHVRDVADANILAATTEISEEYYGQIFNIGNGKNTSILEIAKMISDNYIFIDFRPGEAETTLANIDKVKKVFGWKPKIDLLSWIGENK